MLQPVIGSLCSGYGGLELAFAQAFQGRVAWHAEVNPAAATVLAKHWPGVPNHGDITATKWGEVEPIDILLGGIPCQPVSVAGDRRGDADCRWLWPAARTAIETLRPSVFVLENVANLASHQGGALLTGIVADLVGLGYAVRWTILGACAVEAPHHRHRVFLLAALADRPAGHRVALRPCAPGKKLPTLVARDASGGGLPGAEYLARRAVSGGRGFPLGDTLMLLPTVRASDGAKGGPRGGFGSGSPSPTAALVGEGWGPYEAAVARWAAIHGAPPPPLEKGPRGGMRLGGRFAEWMMGLPAGHVTDLCDRLESIQLLGNGVVPAQGAAALRALHQDFLTNPRG